MHQCVPGIDHGVRWMHGQWNDNSYDTYSIYVGCGYMTFLAEERAAIIPDNNTFCTFIIINNRSILG